MQEEQYYEEAIICCFSSVNDFSLAACGGEKTDKPDDTKPSSSNEAGEAKEIKTTLFTLTYDDSVWNCFEDDMENEEDYCSVNLQIPDPDDSEYYLIDAEIEVSLEDPYDFREDLVYYGFDQYEYKVNEAYETVKIGGVDLLKYDDGEDTLVYFNRIEAAGATVWIEFDAEDITDGCIADLLKGLAFTLEDVGNEDGPWEWEGEAFSTDDHSVSAGAFTVSSEFIPFEEYISTFETFNHSIAAVGDTVYVLVDGELRECHFDGEQLTFVKLIELPEDDYEYINATTDGSLWLSGSMNDILCLKDGAVVNTYEDIYNFAIHPSGAWGVDYFTSNECNIVTFSGDMEKAKEMGAGALAITGNILFYSKSGFVPAKTKGFRYADDPEADYFLIKELTPGFLDGISGSYKDPDGYFVCEKNPEAFEQFEATFPKKEKRKLPGQLF